MHDDENEANRKHKLRIIKLRSVHGDKRSLFHNFMEVKRMQIPKWS